MVVTPVTELVLTRSHYRGNKHTQCAAGCRGRRCSQLYSFDGAAEKQAAACHLGEMRPKQWWFSFCISNPPVATSHWATSTGVQSLFFPAVNSPIYLKYDYFIKFNLFPEHTVLYPWCLSTLYGFRLNWPHQKRSTCSSMNQLPPCFICNKQKIFGKMGFRRKVCRKEKAEPSY